MTTYLGKSCSFCLPRVPFVNCRQFMYLVISLLVLRAGYGIWLYQFLIIAYLSTLQGPNSLTKVLMWFIYVALTYIQTFIDKLDQGRNIHKPFDIILRLYLVGILIAENFCINTNGNH